MNRILWMSLTALSFAVALECPKKIVIELEGAEEYIYTTQTTSNLGTAVKKVLSADLSDLTFLKPVDYKQYEILSKLESTCEWSEHTNKYLKSSGNTFDLKDSTEYSIFRDTNLIQITEQSYLPMGEMDAHIQWTPLATDTLNKGLTKQGTNYQVNGEWLAINSGKLEYYYATLYLKKKEGGIVNYNATSLKDSAALVENIMNSVKSNNYNIDTLYLQVLKLNYVIKDEQIVANLNVKPEKIKINELNLYLPQNTSWVKLYDSKGRLKMNKKINGEKNLNLESLKSGLYFIQTNNKPSQKLIIEK